MIPRAWPLLVVLAGTVLAGGCRTPATRTVATHSGTSCWSQVHLVCRLPQQDKPKVRAKPRFRLPWPFRPQDEQARQLELIYPHPGKGPQWAMVLLHRGTKSGARSRGPAPVPLALAVPRSELEPLLLSLRAPLSSQAGAQAGRTPRQAAPEGAEVRGSVDGQSLYAAPVPADRWLALARRVRRRGHLLRNKPRWPSGTLAGGLVRAYRQAQRDELPLAEEAQAGRRPKKTAQVFRLPGLK